MIGCKYHEDWNCYRYEVGEYPERNYSEYREMDLQAQ